MSIDAEVDRTGCWWNGSTSDNTARAGEDRRGRRRARSPRADRRHADRSEPRRGAGDIPGTGGGRLPANTTNAEAVEVATDFLEAFGALDVGKATTYLAEDATIASMGAQDDLPSRRYNEATGYEQILDPRLAQGYIRCTCFHGLRSSEIGRGPFGGSSSISSFVTARSSESHRTGHREVLRLDVGSLHPGRRHQATWKDAAVTRADDKVTGGGPECRQGHPGLVRQEGLRTRR